MAEVEMDESGTPTPETDEGEHPLDRARRSELEAERLDKSFPASGVDHRQSLFESVFDDHPSGVLVCDAEGSFLYRNPAADDIWEGFDAIANIDDWAEKYGSPTEIPQFEPDEWGLSSVLRTEEPVGPRTVDFERSDGDERRILVSTSPFHGSDGTLAGAIAVFSDVTQLEQIDRALREARRGAERAHRRSEFLAEASVLLNSSLDYDQTLERLAELAVPELGDWCIVDLCGPEHSLTDPVAAAHADEEMAERIREYRRNYPPRSDMQAAPMVMESGEAVLLREIDDEELEEKARDERHLQHLRTIGLRSLMVVPMKVRHRILGAITLAVTCEARRFDQEDLQMAEELARRAALAIDNAEVHRNSEQARRRVTRRAEQQKAVARFARRTLELEREEFVEEALETMSELLDADTAKFLRLNPDSTLTLEGGVGWREEWMGANLGTPDDETAIGFALLENEVVVVEDLDRADLGPTELVRDHDLKSAMTVQVPGPERPFGAIGVHSHRPRKFTREDSEFIRGLSNVLSDALEKDRAENRREATYRRLVETMRQREELLSVVSHDLRSPATTIQLNLALLEERLDSDEPPDESTEEALDTAKRSVDRMIGMMSDLLDFTKENDEFWATQLEEVYFDEIVREVVADFEDRIAESGSELVLELEEGVVGRGDRVRFEQIITNLLSNAVKYGEGEPIEIALVRDAPHIEFTVRDHGVGIPEDVHDQIFSRFQRGDEKEDEKQGDESFGLGLWIVKRAVDVLGGEIAFDSTPGEGTEFRVRVPVERDGRP